MKSKSLKRQQGNEADPIENERRLPVRRIVGISLLLSLLSGCAVAVRPLPPAPVYAYPGPYSYYSYPYHYYPYPYAYRGYWFPRGYWY